MAKTLNDAYGEILRLRNEFYQKWQEVSHEVYDENRDAYKAKYEAFDKALELLTPSIVDPQPKESIEYSPFDDFIHTDSEDSVNEDMENMVRRFKSMFIGQHDSATINRIADDHAKTYKQGLVDGAKWHRGKMLREAVEPTREEYADGTFIYSTKNLVDDDMEQRGICLFDYDKVKLIIIKEE